MLPLELENHHMNWKCCGIIHSVCWSVCSSDWCMVMPFWEMCTVLRKHTELQTDVLFQAFLQWTFFYWKYYCCRCFDITGSSTWQLQPVSRTTCEEYLLNIFALRWFPLCWIFVVSDTDTNNLPVGCPHTWIVKYIASWLLHIFLT